MATPNAPKNLAELETLLKNDIKVKVAGVDGPSRTRARARAPCLRPSLLLSPADPSLALRDVG